jgi:hypothetical protein
MGGAALASKQHYGLQFHGGSVKLAAEMTEAV